MAEHLVIIPTYNEKDNVRRVSEAVLAAAPDSHILFVDDNSPDGTGGLVEELRDKDPRIHILHRDKKEGLGRAYIAGFHWALEREYRYIQEMDADLSHDPADLPRFIEAMKDADAAGGSRYVGGIRVIDWPLSRLIMSMGASLYVRLLTGLPMTDSTGGYNIWSRDVLESIDLDSIQSSGYSFQVEMKHRTWMHGFKIIEVPIIFHERRSGESKMNAAIAREAVWLMWLLAIKSKFRRRPKVKLHPRSVAAASA